MSSTALCASYLPFIADTSRVQGITGDGSYSHFSYIVHYFHLLCHLLYFAILLEYAVCVFCLNGASIFFYQFRTILFSLLALIDRSVMTCVLPTHRNFLAFVISPPCTILHAYLHLLSQHSNAFISLKYARWRNKYIMKEICMQ